MPDFSDVEFHFTKSADLKVQELYDILKLRSDVFIVEYQCPVADVDGDDLKPNVTHSYASIPQKEGFVGYARLESRNDVVLVRRVVVSKEFRGCGLAQKLMHSIINYCSANKVSKIELHSREYFEKFYQRLGFKTVSGVYIKEEINVPHVDMEMYL